MNWIPTQATALVVLAFLAAPLDSRGAQRREDQIIAELRQIQAQLAQLQSSQASLEDAVNALTARVQAREDGERKAAADSQLALDRIQRDLSIVSERVDETNGRLGNLRQELVAMRQTQQPLVIPVQGEEGEGVPAQGAEVDGEPEAEAPVAVAGAPNVTEIYNQARIDYTQGRYTLAISGFQDVLELGRGGDLADNAHYWMGESYSAQRQYQQALEHFDVIIHDYPDSNKRPDAYLKKAMTLELMERRSEAMTMYELVIEQFPRSQQERVARRKLEQLLRTTPPGAR